MKIVKLTSENIKRVKAVNITPDGNVVKITGKNAQGKTSVLDSILYALSGKREIPENVIREGADSGRVELEFENYIIERKFTDKGTYLKVTGKDGSEYSSPQSLLDDFTESIAFDPLEFSRLSDNEQADQLKKVAGIELDDLEEHLQKVYDERRDVGRDVKRLDAKVSEWDEPPEKVDRVNVGELSSDIERLSQLKSEREKHAHAIKRKKEEIAKLQEELEELQSDYDKFEERSDDERLDKLKKEMEKADENNAKATEYERYNELRTEYRRVEKRHTELDEKVESIREEKQERIEKADMPVDGLGLEDGKVVYNGVAFSELSSAEKLRVSMSIAMATNPEIRVILANDASLLDEDNMQIIEEMADDQDYQVWLEIVDSSGEVGFYIEEGSLRIKD